VFVPATITALVYPGLFITALRYAGGISCALLFGLLPPLMVWVGRYVKKYQKEHHQLPGGKIVLAMIILFVVIEMVFQVVL
jgi:tyrosine-specific transport protein